jgi:hypothetical protein
MPPKSEVATITECTASIPAGKAEDPHRKLLRMAKLELRKALCKNVRDAANARVVEMERRLADIEKEQTELRHSVRSYRWHPAATAAGPHFPGGTAPHCGALALQS